MVPVTRSVRLLALAATQPAQRLPGAALRAPDQIAPVNAAYLPSEAELARAERIVAAFKQAEAAGQAAIQVDGEMVDYPVAYRAQTMIDAVRAVRKT